MERVAFLLESTGERLTCLLNPETLVMRRIAGVRARRSVSGALAGAGLADDPLMYTGGGTTELRLDLLFDLSIAGSTIVTEDVRDVTAPFWRMAENVGGEAGRRRPPLVTLVWGKSLNVTGVVTAVAERLEFFNASGAPRRSWMRMRLVRVLDQSPPQSPASLIGVIPSEPAGSGATPAPLPRGPMLRPDELPPETVDTHVMVGPGTGERLDTIASTRFGDPGHWKLIAAFNGIEDPLRIPPGFLLRLPRFPSLHTPAKAQP